ncbi:MAG: ankyrin repeat domain-containing protein [Janthinobacterium lividum]
MTIAAIFSVRPRGLRFGLSSGLPSDLQEAAAGAPRSTLGRRTARAWAASGAAAWLCIGMVAPASAAPLDSMIRGVKFDSASTVREYLSEGVDPNSVDNYGYPLLAIAAREKSDQAAEVLASAPHIDLGKTDKAGENALMLAAINKDDAMVKMLIAKGAEVNKSGWAPLHYAASVGATNIVQMLLDASAYVDAGSPNGTTPLMMAARGGFMSTIKLLTDAGADVTLKNQLGMTAADFAQHYHETEAAKSLQAAIDARKAMPPAAGSNDTPQPVITPLR